MDKDVVNLVSLAGYFLLLLFPLKFGGDGAHNVTILMRLSDTPAPCRGANGNVLPS